MRVCIERQRTFVSSRVGEGSPLPQQLHSPPFLSLLRPRWGLCLRRLSRHSRSRLWPISIFRMSWAIIRSRVRLFLVRMQVPMRKYRRISFLYLHPVCIFLYTFICVSGQRKKKKKNLTTSPSHISTLFSIIFYVCAPPLYSQSMVTLTGSGSRRATSAARSVCNCPKIR